MRTKLKLGRVCRLVASWQAQARRGKAKDEGEEDEGGGGRGGGEARRVGQGKAKAESSSRVLSLPFCSFFARRRLRSPKSPPWLLAAFPLSSPPPPLPHVLTLSLSLSSLVPSSSFSSCSSSPLSYPALRLRRLHDVEPSSSLLSRYPSFFFFFLVLVLFSSFPRFPFFSFSSSVAPALRGRTLTYSLLAEPPLLPSRLFLLLLLPFHKARACPLPSPRLITL